MAHAEAIDKPPVLFRAVKWHGYIFSLTYLLYGGVSLILGFLDRQYDDSAQFFIFMLVGIILMTVSFAFKDHRAWGWYGLVGMNGLIVLIGLIGLTNPYNIVMLVLSLGMLGALFHPIVKSEFF
ncbi:hypothetical protein GF377_00130 [candidate division GN15 bacterium]|nr:hypothetical protein [candidate division GN15 bacterium]